jgi:glycosyltransferase involved in cell wall biosynthesis
MKILHGCLAAFYIDNYSYQENILPKIHKQQGHEVFIIASTETYIKKTKIGYTNAGDYLNEDGIPVKRIPYFKGLPHIIARKLRIYSGLYKAINRIQPDIIYLHDCQFLSIMSVVKYAKKHQVKIIIDSHTDAINSGTSFLSYYILHKLIYRTCVKYIEKYATIFWGTLPLREEFLHTVYGVSKSKIGLLPFGSDDSVYNRVDAPEIRRVFRNEHAISNEDFVIITGGKIDRRKNIILLMQSFIQYVSTHKLNHVKLLVFGQPTDELQEEFNAILNHPNIIYLKWLSASQIHKAFFSADLAFFPGTHSVLWEEAAGIGLPAVYLRWKGITHIDKGGNCVFINEANPMIIQQTIHNILTNKEYYNKMKVSAGQYGPEYFSYSQIAAKAIDV